MCFSIRLSPGTRAMKKSDFDRLLECYLKGEVTVEERVKMEAWLDEAKTKSRLELTQDTEDRMYRRIIGNDGLNVQEHSDTRLSGDE